MHLILLPDDTKVEFSVIPDRKKTSDRPNVPFVADFSPHGLACYEVHEAFDKWFIYMCVCVCVRAFELSSKFERSYLYYR